MENLANALSPTQKTFIVAQSPTNIHAYGPSGIVGRYWFEQVVGRGTFAVDGDRLLLGPSILSLIQLRQDQALREGNLPFYRFLCAITPELCDGTAVDLPKLPLDAWLAQLRFSTVTDEERTSGLSPLRFAVVSNRADLVEELLARGADVECLVASAQRLKESRLSPSAQWLFLPGHSILMTACTFTGGDGQAASAEVVRALLRRGANPRKVESNPPFGHPFLAACVGSKLHLIPVLLEADATLWQLPHVAGILPFEECLMVGTPECATLALTTYAEQLKGLPPGVPKRLECDGRKGLGQASTREDIIAGQGVSHVW